jgi:hypothetical protein
MCRETLAAFLLLLLPLSLQAQPCLEFEAGQSQGLLQEAALGEISGLAASRGQANLLWAHADSGDGANLYALDTAAALRATYTLQGVTAVDWEDIALAPGLVPGNDRLYIGDFGDNNLARPQFTVYTVAEPVVPASPPASPIVLSDAIAYAFSYPLAPSVVYNCEAMFVDPADGALYFATKDSADLDNGVSYVFTPSTTPSSLTTTPLVQVAALDLGTGLFEQVTAADASPAGNWIGIRTYGDIYGWARGPGQSIGAALAGTACDWPLAGEIQGETFAFAPGLAGYYTASERFALGPQPLYYYPRINSNQGVPVIEGPARAEIGAEVVLTVTFSGAIGVTQYAWTRDGQPVLETNEPALTLFGVTEADEGSYQVTITDEAKAVYVSEEFYLEVVAELPATSVAGLLLLALAFGFLIASARRSASLVRQ